MVVRVVVESSAALESVFMISSRLLFVVPEDNCMLVSPPRLTVTSSVTVVVPVEVLGNMVEVLLAPEGDSVTVTVERLLARETTSVTVEKTEVVVVLQGSAAPATPARTPAVRSTSPNTAQSLASCVPTLETPGAGLVVVALTVDRLETHCRSSRCRFREEEKQRGSLSECKRCGNE